MPKVNLGKQPPKWEDKFRQALVAGQEAKHMTNEDLCERLNISRNTFYRYKREPGEMPARILRQIVMVLEFDDIQLRQITGARKSI